MGNIFKCQIAKDPKFYAYKEIHNSEYDSFSKEISMYSNLNHYLVPKFIGVTYDIENGNVFIIPFIPSLKNYTKNHLPDHQVNCF